MDELSQLLKQADNILTYEQTTSEELEIWQKDNLLMRLEQSSISEQLEQFIRFNIDVLTVEDYRKYMSIVIEQTTVPDPRQQYIKYIWNHETPNYPASQMKTFIKHMFKYL